MAERAPKKDAPESTDADYDVVMLAGQTPDGEGAKVVRARPGRVEAGEVRPMKDGRPLAAGELVRLEQRREAPALYDVHVEHVVAPPPATKAAGAGPAQVATDAYRERWERTFGVDPDTLN
jgi:hypothetical protein